MGTYDPRARIADRANLKSEDPSDTSFIPTSEVVSPVKSRNMLPVEELNSGSQKHYEAMGAQYELD